MRKNLIELVGMVVLVTFLCSCGSNDSKLNPVRDDSEVTEEVVAEVETDVDVDVDLTKLSSTMVYSEVYNMMNTPEEYIGKTVKMSGIFKVYTNQEESQFYPTVIISDATACCAQGIEFVLRDDQEYPAVESEITVTGIFESYEEGENTYCRLKNAKIS